MRRVNTKYSKKLKSLINKKYSLMGIVSNLLVFARVVFIYALIK